MKIYNQKKFALRVYLLFISYYVEMIIKKKDMAEVSLYEGSFQTNAFWSYLVFGNMSAYLPIDLQKYIGIAEVTYYGIYKFGTTIQMSLEIVDLDKIRVSNSGQVITFTINKNNSDLPKGVIYGSYLSICPYDSGTFELRKKVKEEYK